TAQRKVDAHPAQMLAPNAVVTPFTEPRSGCYKLKQDLLSVRWGGRIAWHDQINADLSGLLALINSGQHWRGHMHPAMVYTFRDFYKKYCCYVPGLSDSGKAQYGCCGGLRFRPAAWADQ